MTTPTSLESTYTLKIRFAPSTPDKTVRRMKYAFEEFCAFFGYIICDNTSIVINYNDEVTRSNEVSLCGAYVSDFRQDLDINWYPLAENILETSKVPLIRSSIDKPDWLAEIFEWLSGVLEFESSERDHLDRLPFSETLPGRLDIDPEIPWVNFFFILLNEQVRSKYPGLPQNPRPLIPKTDFVIAATHDLDFLPIRAIDIVYRQLKMSAIALIGFRDISLTVSGLFYSFLGLFGGNSLATCLKRLIAKEKKVGIESTCFVIARRGHRRDANYRVEDPGTKTILNFLSEQGIELGVHGSYQSAIEEESLADEYAHLRAQGYTAIGNRQHWLRYNSQSLFELLEQSSAIYDASLGYSDRIGFRNGIASPFRPYNLKREKPFNVIELPLAIMDTALYDLDQGGSRWESKATKILDYSRAVGTGGISILWHDPTFTGIHLPLKLADLYWRLKDDKSKWTNCAEVTQHMMKRYSDFQDGRSRT